jgi:hypothetical protein
VTSWPWAINVSGISHFFATKAAAIEAVQDLQKAGTRSVDVGCMQINLMYHPGAFASLDEAFDPSANTQYGARFLSALYREIGNWPQAAAAYHSRTQDIGASYEMRVMARWPQAGRFSDGTLQQRGRTVAQETDLSIYTPEFAAQVKRQRRDLARLATMSGLIARSEHQPANLAGPGSKMKEMALHDAGHVVSVVNPAQIRDFGRTKLGRNKTDKVDAALSRDYAALFNPAPWTPPSPAMRRLCELQTVRAGIVSNRPEWKNRLGSGLCDAAATKLAAATIEHFTSQLEAVDRAIGETIDQDATLRGRRDLLLSVIEVGETLAASLLAEMPEPRVLRRSAEMVAYAGLNPSQT